MNYDLDIGILGLSETHIKGDGLEEIRAFQKEKHRDYLMYYAGSDTNKHHGVGLLINKELNPSFMKISDRICVAKVVAKHRCIFAISAYAPTLNMSEKYPELREDFYDQLDKTVKSISSRNIVLILGDFNAKLALNGVNFQETWENLVKD